jgi:hypothetical protein
LEGLELAEPDLGWLGAGAGFEAACSDVAVDEGGGDVEVLGGFFDGEGALSGHPIANCTLSLRVIVQWGGLVGFIGERMFGQVGRVLRGPGSIGGNPDC